MPPVVRKSFVRRTALVDMIEKGIDEGFMLISAPPGYGKTLLVADWAAQTQSPVAWLTLDSLDNNLFILNRYLRAMLENIHITIGDLDEELPPRGDASEHLNSILTALINQRANAASDVSLVIDEYQVIDNPRFHEAFTYFLDHFPPHLRLILITRADPPFPLARFRAKQSMLEIHTPELAFSLEETDQFLNIKRNLNLPPEKVKDLFEKTEGWITGLELVSLSLGKSSLIDQPGISLSGSADLTLEYIVDEVINQLPLPTQEFLLRTSILQNLYGPLCDHILEPFSKVGESRTILHELYHANLFLTSLDSSEHWFRYHALFANALRHLLAERYPDQVRGLYLRASEWCDQNLMPDAALNYAASAKDDQRFISLLEKYSLDAIRNDRFLDIVARVSQVDENLLAASAWLSMIQAWGCMLSFDLESGEYWLRKASRLAENTTTEGGSDQKRDFIHGMITAGQSMLAAFRGNMNEALERSAQALQLLPPENDFAHSFALVNQGLALSLNGEPNRAIEVLENAIRESRNSGNWLAMMIARINLGEILEDTGQLNRALTVFSQSIQFLSSASVPISAFEGVIYKDMGSIFLARNELDQAELYLRKAIEPALEKRVLINEFDTHLRLSSLYQARGDLSQAKKELTLARGFSMHSQSPLDDLLLAISDARSELLQNQSTVAQKWAQVFRFDPKIGLSNLNGVPPSLQDNIILLTSRYNLVQGRLIGDIEQIKLATRDLEVLLDPLDKAGLVEHQIEANVLLALAYHEMDQSQEMLDHLGAALRIAEPEGYRQVFLDEGIFMSRLLIHYMAYLKSSKPHEDLPSRSFVSDLLFRLTAGEPDLPVSEPGASSPAAVDNNMIKLFTAREREVLQLLSRGRSNAEIALDLHISINTVKRHLNNIFMKLGVSTRTQAFRVAQTRGLIR